MRVFIEASSSWPVAGHSHYPPVQWKREEYFWTIFKSSLGHGREECYTQRIDENNSEADNQVRARNDVVAPEALVDNRPPQDNRNWRAALVLFGSALLPLAATSFSEYLTARGIVSVGLARVFLLVCGLATALWIILSIMALNIRHRAVVIASGITILTLLLSGLEMWASRRAQSRLNLMRPAPPTLLRLDMPDRFRDLDRPISLSQMESPCTVLKGRKAYLFDKLDSMPGGPGLKRPSLVAKLSRSVTRVVSSSTEDYEYFIEVSVTSRGEPSVAKDWRLCLVYDGQPNRYYPAEIMSSDLSSFQNKTVLEESATSSPIKRGEAVVGWLLFQVPKKHLDAEPLVGSLEFRDYLEHSYLTAFGLSPAATPPQPGLKLEIR